MRRGGGGPNTQHPTRGAVSRKLEEGSSLGMPEVCMKISLRTWHRASENSNCSGISRCSHVICEVNILSTMGRKSGYDVEPPKNWPTGNPRGQRGYLPWGALVKSQRCGTRLSRPSSPGGALRRDPVCAHDAGKCLLTQMDHHWTGTSRGLSRLDTATPRMNFDGSIGLC